jgi:hypothetical protein
MENALMGLLLSPGQEADRRRCLLWDFTCPDTLAPSHLNHSVMAAGSAAQVSSQTREQNTPTSLRTMSLFRWRLRRLERGVPGHWSLLEILAHALH